MIAQVHSAPTIGSQCRARLAPRTGCNDQAVTRLLGLGNSSLLERCAVIGAFSGGAIGAIAGLIIGLAVHWQTAWFAIFEAGIPAGIFGGLLGIIAALIVLAARRTTGNNSRSD